MAEPTKWARDLAQSINLTGNGNTDRARITLALDEARRQGIEAAAKWHDAAAGFYRSSQYDPDWRRKAGHEEYSAEQIRALATLEPTGD